VLGLGIGDGERGDSTAEFDFCEVSGTWAIRDPTGQLHWYAVGNNNFANGVRVWKFDQSTQSFGGRTNTVFAEGSGIYIGSATGIWGSASDDVYVIGEIAAASGGARQGRIYHFNGSSWSRLTEFGEIAPPGGVYGTSSNDVWVSLTDGRCSACGIQLNQRTLRITTIRRVRLASSARRSISVSPPGERRRFDTNGNSTSRTFSARRIPC
jgi:hypothetical protein